MPCGPPCRGHLLWGPVGRGRGRQPGKGAGGLRGGRRPGMCARLHDPPLRPARLSAAGACSPSRNVKASLIVAVTCLPGTQALGQREAAAPPGTGLARPPLGRTGLRGGLRPRGPGGACRPRLLCPQTCDNRCGGGGPAPSGSRPGAAGAAAVGCPHALHPRPAPSGNLASTAHVLKRRDARGHPAAPARPGALRGAPFTSGRPPDMSVAGLSRVRFSFLRKPARPPLLGLSEAVRQLHVGTGPGPRRARPAP